MAAERPDFDEVFAVEFARVARTVYLICRDKNLAEDIAQDAFVELYRRWQRISRYDRPGAWVRRVAIRMTVRSLRHDAIRIDAERAFPAVEGEHHRDTGVLEAVRVLPLRQRAAVVMFYFEDASVAEIADSLGCSAPTARVHLHRARVRLGDLLTRAGADS